MKLTPENKNTIDAMSYVQLLGHWRFAPVGDSWFQGETGEYWAKRMVEVKNQPDTDHVGTSEALGWKP